MKNKDSLNVDKIVTRNPDILSSQIEDETILLSLENSNYYGMAATGSRIWELLAAPTSIGTIVETILQEYEIDREQCEADVTSFLDELLAGKLICEVES